MNSEIPPEIEEQHEGEWLVWDLNARRLAGAAPDLNALDAEVRAVQDAGHEVYLHYVLPRGTVLAGGLFQMRFPTTVREAIHRPIVMLHVASSSGRFVNVDALVDTGADVSLFPNSMASKLGIALPMTSGLPIGSPIGSTTTYRLAEVQLEIRRPPDVLRWRTSIGFVDRPLPYAILGTRGFFEFFRLSYDASQHTFEIEPVDPLPQ